MLWNGNECGKKTYGDGNLRATILNKVTVHQKQLENVKYFNYLGSMITNDARCTWEIKPRIDTEKAAFYKKKASIISKLDLNVREKLVICYIWSTALYGAETWTLLNEDQKHLESFEMCGCRRMVKISWTNHMKNKEVSDSIKKRRNVLHTKQQRRANCVAHILYRNCLLKCFIEGKVEGRIEVME